MKFLKRNIHWLVCTIALIGILCYGFLTAEHTRIRFCVESESGTEEISFYEAEDGSYYVFLPSYADMEQIKVILSGGSSVSLGGISLSDGMDCGDFQPETEYTLAVNGRGETTLQFFRSANVATLYLSTATGSMERIHEDKNYEETSSITLYAADGSLNYLDTACTIKGRGNASWGNDKKPYALTLSSDGNLLGMGAAANWVLLANAYDASNLNNKLVYDLAGQVGFPWAPESMYADVYLNGEYNGLYLLTEKVEVGSNRLDIDTSAGDFLCKIDVDSRWDTLRNPFKTQLGRTVEISEPRILTKADASGIEALVNQMELALLSDQNLRLNAQIDLDSWVRRYLIDEISGNIDSDLASSYFYYANGTVYSGPVWDYDMAFGNSERNENPHAFIAKNAYKSPEYTSPYYSALYENEAFYSRMTEIYRSEFLPVLEQLIGGGIETLSADIAAASEMNRLRWAEMFDTMYEQQLVISKTVESVIGYLDTRTAFLNEAWLEDTDYCTVQFGYTSWSPYRNVSVERGALVEAPQVDTVWIDAKTGEPFDFSQPVLEDTLLTSQADIFYMPEAEEPVINGNAVVICSVSVLADLFLCMAITDIRRRSVERRNTGEPSRTHVSS